MNMSLASDTAFAHCGLCTYFRRLNHWVFSSVVSNLENCLVARVASADGVRMLLFFPLDEKITSVRLFDGSECREENTHNELLLESKHTCSSCNCCVIVVSSNRFSATGGIVSAALYHDTAAGAESKCHVVIFSGLTFDLRPVTWTDIRRAACGVVRWRTKHAPGLNMLPTNHYIILGCRLINHKRKRPLTQRRKLIRKEDSNHMHEQPALAPVTMPSDLNAGLLQAVLMMPPRARPGRPLRRRWRK